MDARHAGPKKTSSEVVFTYLWHGLESPIVCRITQHARCEPPGLDRDIPRTIVASFDHCDRHLWVLGKTGSKCKARGAATRNDIVVAGRSKELRCQSHDVSIKQRCQSIQLRCKQLRNASHPDSMTPMEIDTRSSDQQDQVKKAVTERLKNSVTRIYYVGNLVDVRLRRTATLLILEFRPLVLYSVYSRIQSDSIYKERHPAGWKNKVRLTGYQCTSRIPAGCVVVACIKMISQATAILHTLRHTTNTVGS